MCTSSGSFFVSAPAAGAFLGQLFGLECSVRIGYAAAGNRVSCRQALNHDRHGFRILL